MLKTLLASVAGCCLTLASAQADPPVKPVPLGSTIIFQGGGVIETATPACAGSVKVGDYYRMIYRYKQGLLDPPDSLSILSDDAVFQILSANILSGSLSGSTLTINALVDRNAGVTFGISGTTNMVISSLGGFPTPQAVNMKILGNVYGFFNIPACDVTVRGLLVVRPPV